MTVLAAMRDGAGRVARAPFLLAGTYLALLLVSVPLAIALKAMLQSALGASLAAETMARGVDHDWWQWFSNQAVGLGTTFTPTIIGFAAVLDNVSGLLDDRRLAAVLLGAVGAYLTLSMFLVGGVLDRLARNRPTRAHGFFSACGVLFFRFLRLGVLAAVPYWLLFGPVHRALFDRLYPWVTDDMTVERTAFLTRALLYLVLVCLLGAVNLIVDYAKVRTAVEDRRSMIGAIMAAARFVWRHPGRCVGVYAANVLLFLLLIGLFAVVAPGAGGAGLSMWLGWAVGQLYLIARLALRLLFLASQTALFQGELAHAEYAAGPQAVWPESPAAETVSR